MTLRNVKPIKVVIFDVFDTILVSRIAPHLQYAEEARKFGLKVEDDRMEQSFRFAYKKLNIEHPVYGIHSGLKNADEWWTKCIFECMLHCGVDKDELNNIMPRLGPALIDRFGSGAAYRLNNGVPQVFEQLLSLKDASSPLTLTLATNSDAKILEACRDLGLADYLELNLFGRIAPTLSYNLGIEKPEKEFFHSAVQRAFSDETKSTSLSDQCASTLYVGDSVNEDYFGARNAGLQSVWLRKSPSLKEDIDESEIIDSILQVVSIVQQSWQ